MDKMNLKSAIYFLFYPELFLESFLVPFPPLGLLSLFLAITNYYANKNRLEDSVKIADGKIILSKTF
jgi:hypothetical protein